VINSSGRTDSVEVVGIRAKGLLLTGLMTFVPICGECLRKRLQKREGNAEAPIRGGPLLESMNATAQYFPRKT